MNLERVIRKVDGKAIVEITNDKASLVISIHPAFDTGETTVSWWSKGLVRLNSEDWDFINDCVEGTRILNG